jgi:hypothetical protein
MGTASMTVDSTASQNDACTYHLTLVKHALQDPPLKGLSREMDWAYDAVDLGLKKASVRFFYYLLCSSCFTKNICLVSCGECQNTAG